MLGGCSTQQKGDLETCQSCSLADVHRIDVDVISAAFRHPAAVITLSIGMFSQPRPDITCCMSSGIRSDLQASL